MDDADRSTVGAMHDGPAIKNRAVRDQFQQHCVRTTVNNSSPPRLITVAMLWTRA